MIKEVQNITIEDYNYPLPDERIAKYPLSERDASKLLVLKNDEIMSSHFKNIGDYLPKDSLLIFNETKVVRARLQFTRDSGAAIEIFCLEPITGNGDYQLAFSSHSPSEWKCLVGNSRRWKNDKLTLDINVRPQDYKTTSETICRANRKKQQLFNCQILLGTRRIEFRRNIRSCGRDSTSAISAS